MSQIKGGFWWRVIWYLLVNPYEAGYGSDNVEQYRQDFPTLEEANAAIDSWNITPPGMNTLISDNA
jgi:hypothetical protein